MQPNQQPKLGSPVVIAVKPVDSLESLPESNLVPLSVPPGASYPSSIGSLRPMMAASVRPSQTVPSLAPAALPGRRRRLIGAALAAASIAAIAAIALPHLTPRPPLVGEIVSGRAGLRTTPSGADEHWAAPPAFVLDPSLDRIHEGAKEAVIEAFATWGAAGLGLPAASFTISSTPGVAVQDGVSRILYAPIELAGKEDALAITIAYADAANGKIVEADVIVNAKHHFDVVAPQGGGGEARECDHHFDLQNVVTHEAGHVYGLGEDTSDQTTTMYFISQPCETHKRTLSASDQSVMTSLYAPFAASASKDAPPNSGGCGGATVASRAPMPGGFSWGLGGAAAALIPLRRYRRRSRAD